MENILHDFNQNVINLVTNYLKNSISDGNLSNFTDDLVMNFADLGRKVTEFLVNYAEKTIFELKDRKSLFESLEKDERTIITIFGNIFFERRYYRNKETNEKVYLLDEFLALEPKQRMLSNVKERLVEEAVETSYQRAGEKAAYGVNISKQTVMNEIESLDLDKHLEGKKLEKKKKVKILYVIADEDHVHLQKGGIEEPRAVIVYDSIESNGKRIELKNKKHFGGIYKNRIDDLWETVMTYIDNTYDVDYLEKAYLSGDGANWIKTGLEWIIKSVYVLDEFHLKKAVNGIVGRISKDNKAEKENLKYRLKNSIRNLDFDTFKELSYEILAEEMNKSTRKRKEELMNYILNNVEGITNLYKNKDVLHGCSAEGHISHIYSDRMSSRPMGWKTKNVNNMSKLRLLREDHVPIKEIVKKDNKVIEFKQIEKIRNQANHRIAESINFNPVSIPVQQFGTFEERILLKNILDYRAI